MTKDYVRLTIGMSSDFKKRLRKAAADVELPMAQYIHRILNGYLLREETFCEELDEWIEKAAALKEKAPR